MYFAPAEFVPVNVFQSVTAVPSALLHWYCIDMFAGKPDTFSPPPASYLSSIVTVTANPSYDHSGLVFGLNVIFGAWLSK